MYLLFTFHLLLNFLVVSILNKEVIKISDIYRMITSHLKEFILIPTYSRLFSVLTHEVQKQRNNNGSHHSKYTIRSVGCYSRDMDDHVTLRGDSGPRVNHSHFCVSRLLRIVHFDFHKEGDDVFCR